MRADPVAVAPNGVECAFTAAVPTSRRQPPDATRGALRTAPLRTPVRIKQILFGVVREACRELGVAVGDELSRIGDTGGYIVVELPTHQRVELEHALARFIEVEAIPST